MKLSEWAKKQGVSYRTAWRWFKAGILPVPVKQLSNGTILLSDLDKALLSVAIYARVSSSDQKTDLDRQVSRLVTFANEKGLSVSKTVTEIGSGLNGHRPKLIKLLADKSIGIILIEHRDRLMRFGAEYVESALAAEGRRLLVADQGELNDDLVRDMIEVLTSFCARLYGKRSAKNKAKKALEAIQNENK
jgi:putative resolvase